LDHVLDVFTILKDHGQYISGNLHGLIDGYLTFKNKIDAKYPFCTSQGLTCLNSPHRHYYGNNARCYELYTYLQNQLETYEFGVRYDKFWSYSKIVKQAIDYSNKYYPDSEIPCLDIIRKSNFDPNSVKITIETLGSLVQRYQAFQEQQLLAEMARIEAYDQL